MEKHEKVDELMEFDAADVTVQWLNSILNFIQKLFNKENSSSSLPYSENVRDLLARIAEALIRSCIGCALVRVDKADFRSKTGDDELGEFPSQQAYQNAYFRSYPNGLILHGDRFKQILYSIRPIALDIACMVCDFFLGKEEVTKLGCVGSAYHAIMILFSFWLPISPQIEPIVSKFFAGKYVGDRKDRCSNPLDKIYLSYNNQQPSRHVTTLSILGGLHRLLFYYRSFGRSSGGAANYVLDFWWDWDISFLFECLSISHNEGSIESSEYLLSLDAAIRYHAAHSVALFLDFRTDERNSFFARLNVDDAPSYFEIDGYYPFEQICKGEEHEIQRLSLTFRELRSIIPLHKYLCHPANGDIIVPKKKFESDSKASGDNSSNISNGLILTPTTRKNLSLLTTSLFASKDSVLVCGPNSAGKSVLVRELARLVGQGHDLLELHLDDQTDSKSLLGSYVATDVPGKFEWRAGALTRAVQEGRWILLEDVDTAPSEVLAALIPLIENRILPLEKNGDRNCAHPSFRFIATCTTLDSLEQRGESSERLSRRLSSNANAHLLSTTLWQKVYIEPLPLNELKEIGLVMYPSLPISIIDASLKLFCAMDDSRRDVHQTLTDGDRAVVSNLNAGNKIHFNTKKVGRKSSVRDFMKLCGRISKNVPIEASVNFLTESQRTLCVAESVDVFVSASPLKETRKAFIMNVAAPIWGIPADFAIRYIETRKPSVDKLSSSVHIGRVVINRNNATRDAGKSTFIDTNYSLRLMESISVCISQNEPALLVGETGTGKTTLIQRLASLSNQNLIVQNMSLQTDSSDLLGGYRPLDIKQTARKAYVTFLDLFVSSFSRKKNSKFLNYINAAFERNQWKKLSQALQKGAKMGIDKTSDNRKWKEAVKIIDNFERQRAADETGLAFAFTEGALVDALQNGKWILLDEINLASSETLQRLSGLLDDANGSVVITERGDSEAIERHPNFRLFAAMNPATDIGKKDLPLSMRSRFTEIFVDELEDPVELRLIAAQYFTGVVTSSSKLEHSDIVMKTIEVYIKCRRLAEKSLTDSAGQRPRYTLRTLCRALAAARELIFGQNFSFQRALLEGFELAFEGPLDEVSRKGVKEFLCGALGKGLSAKEIDHPARRPGKNDDFVLVKPFWIGVGPAERIDWTMKTVGKAKFVLTPSAKKNVRSLARAVAAGPWNVLLEGPTSAGKTTVVEFLAAYCGHRCLRINNHEHTDVQEYTGFYTSDSSGKFRFKDGILVEALRNGYWLILDELNLAPSEVLESLNRLLDDNRELFIPETNEVIRPHPNFRLFATQNPSGVYGGRKPLSRAFRNRFVELHIGDIPPNEMITILEARCACPSSHAKLLVNTMNVLRQRRSSSGLFRGKDGLITPRDLLRWAERQSMSKSDLAVEGYMLLGERLREEKEKELVRKAISDQFHTDINTENVYHSDQSWSRVALHKLRGDNTSVSSVCPSIHQVASTKAMLRLVHLVKRCIDQKEPVLLVGETGCGKTTVVQLLTKILEKDLEIINCHAHTETSDFIGGLRPLRERNKIILNMVTEAKKLLGVSGDLLPPESIPSFLLSSIQDDCDLSKLNSLFAASSITPSDASSQILAFAEAFDKCYSKLSSENVVNDMEQKRKRRKLDSEVDVQHAIENIKSYYKRSKALFEWVDGPLVTSMKKGKFLLIDELSLAEDAVLERLNSVLEPARMLVLAEKGGMDADENIENEIVAHNDFRLFATMNPGGDFGKRELSPALRSRFTEIWIPAITDRDDIYMVLKLAFERGSDSIFLQLCNPMLSYVEWFNDTVCGEKSSSRIWSDFVLSLRDILGWANFIIDYGGLGTVGIWSAFLHGASLMHLDGLGLGTGLSSDDAKNTRSKAKFYLIGLVPDKFREESLVGFVDESFDIEKSFITSQGVFGIKPFLIRTGNEPIPSSLNFNLKAPTTCVNLRRVLRAMQLKKPILLEGSPGVGKTSLISALARVSGHNLVRINLSEQTDISDLMGSDLPVVDESAGADGSMFSWCDGVFLKALKRGDWVLLDELNLASQTVLEGLNSCFDHRAQVFVPELGQTFDCPDSFRVFAAQNPLAQGGGRKGLPKSFLNRFTKVYVDALLKDDLSSIVAVSFPSIETDVVDKMVSFTNSLQEDITSRRLFGQLGSPWEFNLRDVFRWCELMVAESKTGTEGAAQFVDAIFIDRFRCKVDREMARKKFQSFFRTDIPPISYDFNIFHHFIQIGNAKSPRHLPNETDSYFGRSFQRTEPDILRTLQRPMETVARCVNMNWPCLLVGGTSSGKSTILRVLSESMNIILEEMPLTPSSDVSDLLGSFEQIDCEEWNRFLEQGIASLYRGSCRCLVNNNEELHLLGKIINMYNLFTELQSQRNSDNPSRFVEESTITYDLIALFKKATIICEHFGAFAKKRVTDVVNLFARLRERNINSIDGGGVFRWVDGILVNSMLKGHWLHLENANLCASSVLDRLNPLMEVGGELILTECGAFGDDNASGARIIKPHPNFRLFLSMKPSLGDVSRAMRNRCIEVCLLSEGGSEEAVDTEKNVNSFRITSSTLDSINCLQRLGVGLVSTAKKILIKYQREVELVKSANDEFVSKFSIQRVAEISMSLLAFGYQIDFALSVAQNLVYGTTEYVNELNNLFIAPASESDILFRHVRFWPMRVHYPLHAQILLNARVLELVITWEKIGKLPDGFLFLNSCLPIDSTSVYDKFEEYRMKSYGFHRSLLNLTLGNFLKTSVKVDRDLSIYYLSIISKKHLPLATGVLEYLKSIERTEISSTMLNRVAQRVEEVTTFHQLKYGKWDGSCPSVIEVSYMIAKGIADCHNFTCEITPFLFHLFEALDNLISYWSSSCFNAITNVDVSLLKHLILQRDKFWSFLRNASFVPQRNSSSFLNFDEEGFFVHLRWFNKVWTKFHQVHIRFDEDGSCKRTKLVFEAFHERLQNLTGVLSTSSDILWKKGGHPKVPFKAKYWEARHKLENLAQNGCVITDFLNPQHSVFDLETLVSMKHQHLYVDSETKHNILGALCMTQWACTDELDIDDVVPMNQTNKKYNIIQVQEQLSEKINAEKERFLCSLGVVTLDTRDSTTNNQLNLDEIRKLHPNVASADNFVQGLLRKWAYVQTSQLVEVSLVYEEIELIQILCSASSRYLQEDSFELKTDLRRYIPHIREFVFTALEKSMWSPHSLRPYQTLLWALESDSISNSSMRSLIKNVLPLMFSYLSFHLWSNSFVDIDRICPAITSPSLWKDSNSDLNVRDIRVGINNFKHDGPLRLRQPVRSQLLLRLYGRTSIRVPRWTLENFHVRYVQAKSIISHLGTRKIASQTLSMAHVLIYQFSNIIHSLKTDFTNSSSSRLLIKMLNDMALRKSTNRLEDMKDLLRDCQEVRFVSLLNTVVYPLLEALTRFFDFKETSYSMNLARAWIFCGVLQLQLLLPSSPVDPTKKPAAKVNQWKNYISNLGLQLSVYQWESRTYAGDDFVRDDHISFLLDQTSHSIAKKEKQEKKVVERPLKSKPFPQLFKEFVKFTSTIGSLQTILKLVKSFDANLDSAFANEQNWQETVCAFITRITDRYREYEDVYVPFVVAIRNIQLGLNDMKRVNKKKDNSSCGNNTLSSLLSFPIRPYIILCESEKLKECREGVPSMFASVAKVELCARVNKSLDELTLLLVRNVFDKIILGWKRLQLSNIDDERYLNEREEIINESEEEKDLRKMREHFPDHAVEFIQAMDSMENQNQDEIETDAFFVHENLLNLTDCHISLLVEAHKVIFNEHIPPADDCCRMRAFLWNYDAASAYTNSDAFTNEVDERDFMGFHMLAISLSANSMNSSSFTSRLHRKIDELDFHYHPNPEECLKAEPCLSDLFLRLNQLLRAFPGNDILVSVCKIIEKVRRLDLSNTSVGKVLSGLELILRKSQEWEQYASERVKLGLPLKSVSTLVARWRKLELSSWKSLLNLVERKHSDRAKRYWLKLYSLIWLNESLNQTMSDLCTKWVWKGLERHEEKEKDGKPSSLVKESNDYLEKLMQLFDTFLLNSTIGEFETRLQYIFSFANQVVLHAKGCESLPNKRTMVKLGRILMSFWKHYSFLLPKVKQIKERKREPLEMRLANEVKLAKWDEQSYYALAESTEKSHMKLMNLLKEYEEILQIRVNKVLEEDFIQGVRQSSENIDRKATTNMPSNKILFPELEGNEILKTMITQNDICKLPMHEFVGKAGSIIFSSWKYLSGMRGKSKKAKEIVDKLCHGDSWAARGSLEAEGLCDDIFERLKNLRQKNTPKPVKQRALVDLFKMLKRHGFSSTRWSVPSQSRIMFHLLQLPFATKEQNQVLQKCSCSFEDGERYFHRCLIEISRFRNEVLIFGSEFMSQREMNLMVGFADHGFFMLVQQKCLIDKVSEAIELTLPFVKSFDQSIESTPVDQIKIHSKISELRKSINEVHESMMQTLVFLRNISPLVTSGREVIRDCSVAVTSFSTKLDAIAQYIERISTLKVIINDHLVYLFQEGATLKEMLKEFTSYAEKCSENNVIPMQVFQSTIDSIQVCMNLVEAIKRDHEIEKNAFSNINISPEVQLIFDNMSSMVEKVLISVQKLVGLSNDPINSEYEQDNVDEKEMSFLWQMHRSMAKEWSCMNFEGIIHDLEVMVNCLHRASSCSNSYTVGIAMALGTDSCSLLNHLIYLWKHRLDDFVSFYRNSGKFIYVIIRIFRNLVSNGFCSDDVQDGEGEGSGDISDMKFEDDVEGTGMGSGEGKEDVTDQLENEEQLLGNKDEEAGEKEDQNRNEELDEEEADKGMEMEGNFDGDLFDVPESNKSEEKDDEGEEELDREMGDGEDPNENIVDEKMWEDSDDEGQNQETEEKFEDDNKMESSELLEDEMRTREDNDESKLSDEKPQEKQSENKSEDKDEKLHEDEGEHEDGDDTEQPFNEDTDDKYEDNAGVDVRNEKLEEESEEIEDEMDLGDELNLDDNDGNDQDEERMEGGDMDEEGGMESEEEDTIGEGKVDDVDSVNSSSDDEGDALHSTGVETHEENEMDVDDNDEQPEHPELNNEEVVPDSGPESNVDAHGVSAQNGKSSIMDEGKEGEDDASKDEGGNVDSGRNEQNLQQSRLNQGTSEDDSGEGEFTPSNENINKKNREMKKSPNPFDDPGDAEKFWHERLNMVETSTEMKEESAEDTFENDEHAKDEANNNGTFEFSDGQKNNTTQVLGDITEENAKPLERDDEKEDETEERSSSNINDESPSILPDDSKEEKKYSENKNSKNNENEHVEWNAHSEMNDEESAPSCDEIESVTLDIQNHGDGNDFADLENKVVTDLSQMELEARIDSRKDENTSDLQFSVASNDDLSLDRSKWSAINAQTNSYSRRLCEKLRLVMEPLVATKLQGDYRTGKRINMKRVISYIASGFRKDKIWLRRTKPAKRDYRVLLAVDNSESMLKSGAGEMALAALATLANGMSQLEIGELGVASFGEEMKLLHPFERPWTNESGSSVVQNLKFDEKRTKVGRCVETAFSTLERASCQSSYQLVFVLSDGRIERDNRLVLRRIIREMNESNILVVMIIVEGNDRGGKDSILEMKEVTFENGKPKIKNFMESYPFAYYLVLEDMYSLPEVLGDALRQWFEMLGQQM